jgi:acyl carrier protein
MLQNEIENKLKSIIAENVPMQMPLEQIGLESNLFSLGMDSINILKVIVGIETEFGFMFEDEDLNADNFRDLNNIITYIERRIENV